MIKFNVPQKSNVRFQIFDILGKIIDEIVNNELSAGEYLFHWDGSNYSSGVYFYRIVTEDFSESKKMILIK
jgi:flagellar hook assembly protein FlgD